MIQTGALYELCETVSQQRVILYLISVSVNGKLKNDTYGIYSKYYENGLIASCVHYKTIMTKCHLKDRKTFMGTLRELEIKGLIKREKAKRIDGTGWLQNVYVIGKWFKYGDGNKIWKQLFLMEAFYKMYPEKEPGNE